MEFVAVISHTNGWSFLALSRNQSHVCWPFHWPHFKIVTSSSRQNKDSRVRLFVFILFFLAIPKQWVCTQISIGFGLFKYERVSAKKNLILAPNCTHWPWTSISIHWRMWTTFFECNVFCSVCFLIHYPNSTLFSNTLPYEIQFPKTWSTFSTEKLASFTIKKYKVNTKLCENSLFWNGSCLSIDNK